MGLRSSIANSDGGRLGDIFGWFVIVVLMNYNTN